MKGKFYDTVEEKEHKLYVYTFVLKVARVFESS